MPLKVYFHYFFLCVHLSCMFGRLWRYAVNPIHLNKSHLCKQAKYVHWMRVYLIIVLYPETLPHFFSPYPPLLLYFLTQLPPWSPLLPWPPSQPNWTCPSPSRAMPPTIQEQMSPTHGDEMVSCLIPAGEEQCALFPALQETSWSPMFRSVMQEDTHVQFKPGFNL